MTYYQDFALWYDINAERYYWQDGCGYGDLRSQPFKTKRGAIRSAEKGELRLYNEEIS